MLLHLHLFLEGSVYSPGALPRAGSFSALLLRPRRPSHNGPAPHLVKHVPFMRPHRQKKEGTKTDVYEFTAPSCSFSHSEMSPPVLSIFFSRYLDLHYPKYFSSSFCFPIPFLRVYLLYVFISTFSMCSRFQIFSFFFFFFLQQSS